MLLRSSLPRVALLLAFVSLSFAATYYLQTAAAASADKFLDAPGFFDAVIYHLGALGALSALLWLGWPNPRGEPNIRKVNIGLRLGLPLALFAIGSLY